MIAAASIACALALVGGNAWALRILRRGRSHRLNRWATATIATAIVGFWALAVARAEDVTAQAVNTGIAVVLADALARFHVTRRRAIGIRLAISDEWGRLGELMSRGHGAAHSVARRGSNEKITPLTKVVP